MSARDVYAAAVAVRRWTDETQTVVTTEDVLVHHVARAITQAREEGGRRGPMGLRDKIRAWLGVPVCVICHMPSDQYADGYPYCLGHLPTV